MFFEIFMILDRSSQGNPLLFGLQSSYDTVRNPLINSQFSGCCPNRNPFERSLKRFLPINLGEAEDQRFELFDPAERESFQIA